jgi:hypothetical protein
VRKINETLNVQLLPWQLDELPEDWVDSMKLYCVDVPRLLAARVEDQRAQAAADNAAERFFKQAQAEHPTYRKWVS